jgi:hypothetical protein
MDSDRVGSDRTRIGLGCARASGFATLNDSFFFGIVYTRTQHPTVTLRGVMFSECGLSESEIPLRPATSRSLRTMTGGALCPTPPDPSGHEKA